MTPKQEAKRNVITRGKMPFTETIVNPTPQRPHPSCPSCSFGLERHHVDTGQRCLAGPEPFNMSPRLWALFRLCIHIQRHPK